MSEEQDKAAAVYSAAFSLTQTARSRYTDELAFKAGWHSRDKEVSSLRSDLAIVTTQRDRNIEAATAEGRYRDLYRHLCSRVATWIEVYFNEEIDEFICKWLQDYEEVYSEEKL